mgnify:CR=1 FL=1
METNFKDRERLHLLPDLEGITRPVKDAKTKKFVFRVWNIGVTPMKLSIYAESKIKAIKYAKARWNSCKLEFIK